MYIFATESGLKISLQVHEEKTCLHQIQCDHFCLYNDILFVKEGGAIQVFKLYFDNLQNFNINLQQTYKLPSTDTSSALIEVDRHKQIRYVCVDNDSHYMMFFPFMNDECLPVKIKLDFLSKKCAVLYVLYQDCFLYLITRKNCDGKNQFMTQIISPCYDLFGEVQIQANDVKSPILVGHFLFFVDGKEVRQLCLVSKTKKQIFQCEDQVQSILILKNQVMVVVTISCIYNIDLNDMTNCRTLYMKKRLDGGNIFQVDCLIYGESFHHYGSDLLIPHVWTQYHDQMNANYKSICELLCELSMNIYGHDDIINEISIHGITSSSISSMFRDLEKCIFLGKDVDDILRHPQTMFTKTTNYQHILRSMTSLIGARYKAYNCIGQAITKYCVKNGLTYVPNHYISGSLHCIWPRYGKGWHHNIDSAPRGKCDVVYFVCTDVNSFGGSFFFYRHPKSKQIHAVPDIHGTLKFFILVSDHVNPLWHAIGSYNAHRISFGLSKRADLELLEPRTTEKYLNI